MPTLAVLDPGLSSIQGLGRYGSQRYGIAPGGAMDRFALAESNALTGQPAGAAAIEIGPNPARFRVLGGTIRVAFAGAERTVYIDDRPVKLGQSYLAHAGEIVSVRGARAGRYTYFSVQGGLQGRDMAHGPYTEREPAVMEHRNSWVLSSADGIQVLPAVNTKIERQLKLSKSDNRPIRVVLGPQIEYFTTDAMESFLSAAWAISHASNRMAYFLDGPAVVAVGRLRYCLRWDRNRKYSNLRTWPAGCDSPGSRDGRRLSKDCNNYYCRYRQILPTPRRVRLFPSVP